MFCPVRSGASYIRTYPAFLRTASGIARCKKISVCPWCDDTQQIFAMASGGPVQCRTAGRATRDKHTTARSQTPCGKMPDVFST